MNYFRLYTCIGKGGVYNLIGTAKGAGSSRDCESMVIYQSLRDKQIYMRTQQDFNHRMQLLTVEDKRTLLREYIKLKEFIDTRVDRWPEFRLDDMIDHCERLEGLHQVNE